MVTRLARAWTSATPSSVRLTCMAARVRMARAGGSLLRALPVASIWTYCGVAASLRRHAGCLPVRVGFASSGSASLASRAPTSASDSPAPSLTAFGDESGEGGAELILVHGSVSIYMT